MLAELPASPPRWVRWASMVSQLLPRGRFQFINWVGRHAPPVFLASLPPELGGLRYLCDLRDAIGRQVYFTGAYEPQELAVFAALIKPGQTIVDVGANWGFYTLIAAALTQSEGRVLAFEPDPEMARIMEANIELNGLGERITVFKKAVADRSGFLPFLSNFEGSLSRTARPNEDTSRNVECIRLDDFFDGLGQDLIHLVKMDIEGAEALALPGMSGWLSSHRIQRLLVEVHANQFQPYYQTDTRAVLGLLSAAGYRGFTWKSDYDSMRQAAYAVHLDPRAILEPFDINRATAERYHVLWVAPEVELPLG